MGLLYRINVYCTTTSEWKQMCIMATEQDIQLTSKKINKIHNFKSLIQNKWGENTTLAL